MIAAETTIDNHVSVMFTLERTRLRFLGRTRHRASRRRRFAASIEIWKNGFRSPALNRLKFLRPFLGDLRDSAEASYGAVCGFPVPRVSVCRNKRFDSAEIRQSLHSKIPKIQKKHRWLKLARGTLSPKI
jgi:hypothetical protein